jgi:hypothetical protein
MDKNYQSAGRDAQKECDIPKKQLERESIKSRQAEFPPQKG